MLAVEVGIVVVVAGIAVAVAVVAGGSTAGQSESVPFDWPGSRLFAVEIFEIGCSLRQRPP